MPVSYTHLITADNYSEKLNNADATIIVQSGSTAEAFAQENFPKAKICLLYTSRCV